jgi:hypothetical protein
LDSPPYACLFRICRTRVTCRMCRNVPRWIIYLIFSTVATVASTLCQVLHMTLFTPLTLNAQWVHRRGFTVWITLQDQSSSMVKPKRSIAHCCLEEFRLHRLQTGVQSPLQLENSQESGQRLACSRANVDVHAWPPSSTGSVDRNENSIGISTSITRSFHFDRLFSGRLL